MLRSGLEQRFANTTSPKADCPQKVERDDKAAERVALIPEPPSPPETEVTYWARLSQKLEMGFLRVLLISGYRANILNV